MNYRGLKIGPTVADVYAFNTLGCIFGSLAAGFILIPMIGVEKTLLIGGGANFIVAAFLIMITSDQKKVGQVCLGNCVRFSGNRWNHFITFLESKGVELRRIHVWKYNSEHFGNNRCQFFHVPIQIVISS